MARITRQLKGSPIVDATRDAALVITDKDIKLANPMDPSSCAAALACKRVFKAVEARVHIGVTVIKRNGKWLRYRTPPATKQVTSRATNS